MTDFPHIIDNGILRAAISAVGAELMSVQKLFPNKKPVEYLWNGDKKHWSGRSPILFPVVGRVKNGSYRYRDKTYSIHCPHGFLQSVQFIPEDTNDAERAAFVFISNETTLEQYPFPFRFRVEYLLQENGLLVTFDVHNAGTETMPFSLGFHPGFFVPLDSSERFEDCSIRFQSDETPQQLLLDGVWMSGQSIPYPLEGKRNIPLRRELFTKDAIILDAVQKKSVSICNARSEPYLTLDYSNFRYLLLWQPPKGTPPFLCLEAWNGLPDKATVDVTDIMTKPEMILLAPGQCYAANLALAIH